MLKTKYNNFKEELHMYLVKTTNGDKILNSADAVKSIKKEDIEKIYFLTEVNYDSVISNADIRDCIYSYLKGKQLSKETVVDYVASVLDVKKNEVSKVITAMKREKIIYVERDYGSIGID
jgi:CTP synthase (UTP-ammonia lyase)